MSIRERLGKLREQVNKIEQQRQAAPIVVLHRFNAARFARLFDAYVFAPRRVRALRCRAGEANDLA